MIELLAPQQSREGLPLDPLGVVGERAGREGIELVGLGDAFANSRRNPPEHTAPSSDGSIISSAAPHESRLPRCEIELVPRARFGGRFDPDSPRPAGLG